MRAYIKLAKLPEAPKTAPRPKPQERSVIPTIAEAFAGHDGQTYKDSASRARARRMGIAEKRHDAVRRFAELGLSDAEIAERTGYKEDSVRRLVTKMRKEGADIPERKRGRKRCTKQQGARSSQHGSSQQVQSTGSATTRERQSSQS